MPAPFSSRLSLLFLTLLLLANCFLSASAELIDEQEEEDGSRDDNLTEQQSMRLNEQLCSQLQHASTRTPLINAEAKWVEQLMKPKERTYSVCSNITSKLK